MQNYQCKCGKHTAFGSYGPADCVVCDSCGSTLAQHPDFHPEPVPHKISVEIYGDKRLRAYCSVCHLRLGLNDAPRAALVQMQDRLYSYIADISAALSNIP